MWLTIVLVAMMLVAVGGTEYKSQTLFCPIDHGIDGLDAIAEVITFGNDWVNNQTNVSQWDMTAVWLPLSYLNQILVRGQHNLANFPAGYVATIQGAQYDEDGHVYSQYRQVLIQCQLFTVTYTDRQAFLNSLNTNRYIIDVMANVAGSMITMLSISFSVSFSVLFILRQL